MIGWEGGSTRRWRTTRRLVLARDRHITTQAGKPWCRVRVPGVCVGETDPMHVHHLHGKGPGSTCQGCKMDDPSHLRAACSVCNLHLGAPEQGDADPPAVPVTNWG